MWIFLEWIFRLHVGLKKRPCCRRLLEKKSDTLWEYKTGLGLLLSRSSDINGAYCPWISGSDGPWACAVPALCPKVQEEVDLNGVDPLARDQSFGLKPLDLPKPFRC